MSRNYDNWERLVAAVIKREEDWQLCHQLSIRTISMCSEASSISDFGSSSNYIEVSDDVFEIENNQESDDWKRLVASSLDDLSDPKPVDQKPVPKLVTLHGCLKRIRELSIGKFGTSVLTQLQQAVILSDREFLAEGTQLVRTKLWIKVLKVTEEEFSIVLGNCRHENVAVPRAYHFSNEGNFIFNDYHRQGSVYDLLHAKKDGRPDWESRLKIAIGAAKGIAHIHEQCGGRLAHGNIKSSNIFLNSEQYGCVSEFGLAGIMITRPGDWPAAPRHSYEYNLKNASQESDAYSFGVVLLELLSGKSPVEPQGGFWGKMNLVEWALSMRLEDWSSKLFDQSLWSSKLFDQSLWNSKLFDQSLWSSKSAFSFLFCDELDMFNSESGFERKIKAEMVEMSVVATRCLATSPQDRPKMFEVVLNLNNICNIPRSTWITTKLNCCLLRHY